MVFGLTLKDDLYFFFVRSSSWRYLYLINLEWFHVNRSAEFADSDISSGAIVFIFAAYGPYL